MDYRPRPVEAFATQPTPGEKHPVAQLQIMMVTELAGEQPQAPTMQVSGNEGDAVRAAVGGGHGSAGRGAELGAARHRRIPVWGAAAHRDPVGAPIRVPAWRPRPKCCGGRRLRRASSRAPHTAGRFGVISRFRGNG